jgi:hypothetical protein
VAAVASAAAVDLEAVLAAWVCGLSTSARPMMGPTALSEGFKSDPCLNALHAPTKGIPAVVVEELA